MKKRHTPEQIVGRLREADELLSGGASIADVSIKLGVSEATYHRWRRRYGGVEVQALKKLKALEKENARLKKIVADQAVDISILKEVAEGNF
jgi:putative transposase